MTRALTVAKAKEEIQCSHDLCYGDNGISLSRRLLRQGNYWTEMAKEAAKLQSACS